MKSEQINTYEFNKVNKYNFIERLKNIETEETK